jgi:IS30 family transposase
VVNAPTWCRKNLSKRYVIFAFKKQRIYNSEIVRTLARDKSIISRELKMNTDGRSKHYRPELKHRKAAHRHLQNNNYKAFTAQIQENIIYWLEKNYSPKQIKGDAVNNKCPCLSI